MLLVFLASCCSARQILKIVSIHLVSCPRWVHGFWDCTGDPPKSMHTTLLEEVGTTQNALPPIFEGVWSLFADRTLVILAMVKA